MKKKPVPADRAWVPSPLRPDRRSVMPKGYRDPGLGDEGLKANRTLAPGTPAPRPILGEHPIPEPVTGNLSHFVGRLRGTVIDHTITTPTEAKMPEAATLHTEPTPPRT